MKRGYHKRDTVDPAAPMCGAAKRKRIDLGLALLSVAAVPGERYSREEIAAWCGCTDSMIFNIERKALRKLRNRLFFLKDPALRELVETALGCDLDYWR